MSERTLLVINGLLYIQERIRFVGSICCIWCLEFFRHFEAGLANGIEPASVFLKEAVAAGRI